MAKTRERGAAARVARLLSLKTRPWPTYVKTVAFCEDVSSHRRPLALAGRAEVATVAGGGVSLRAALGSGLRADLLSERAFLGLLVVFLAMAGPVEGEAVAIAALVASCATVASLQNLPV